MRALTSIQSSTNITADLEFHLKLSDQSTTFIFDRDDITEISPINWEVPFGGGFGKPSNYKITLATSVDFIKTYRKGLINAESSLKVYVNSDNFVPSIGRVRNLTRFPSNLNLIELQVYDKFLDSNPKVPTTSIVDSYSVVHPEVIASDMGYPLYYGKHTRPFYMTAVDCDISNLLGPKNVSSANHVTNLWYTDELTKVSSQNLYKMGATWKQESAGNNTTSYYTFGITQDDPTLVQPIEFTATLGNCWVGGGFWVQDNAGYQPEQYQQSNGFFHADCTAVGSGIQRYKKWLPVEIKPRLDNISKLISIQCSVYGQELNLSGAPIGTRGHSIGVYFIARPPYTINYISPVASTSSNSENFNYNCEFPTVTFSNMNRYPFQTDKLVGILFRHYPPGAVGQSRRGTYAVTYSTRLQLDSNAYKNYSIFGNQVNCSDIAISENPMGIAANIISQTSFGYVASQNSQAQYDTQSYHLQCFMGQRRDLTEILDEFGRISSTYMWVGDSGFINFNTCQNSQTITASALIAATISTSDFLRDSLTIRDNPLGTTTYNTQKASRFKVDYDYNFQTDQYEQSNVANPQNNIYCESAEAGGIQTSISVQTQYIKESYTSSLYLRNLIRSATQDEQIVEMKLPARFFNLELTDVVKIQHPVLVGSESLFQITKINPDYLKGTVRITANEVQNI